MARSPRQLAPLFASLLILAAPAVAFGLTDAEEAELKRAIADGTEAYKAGRYVEAVEAFERAEAISPNPRIQFNLGRALEEAGECQRSRARFEMLSKNENAEDVVRERASKKLDGGLDCTPVGTIAFTCETPNTKVLFDGNEVACGSSLRAETRPYRWTATSPGYMQARGRITPVEGETVTVVVGLTPPPAASSPWKLFAGGGLVTAGVGAFAVGIASDLTASSRSEQIIDASEDGDTDRLARLQEASNSARTQTLILYSTGAALAVGGGILLWLHFSEGDDESLVVAPSFSDDGAGVQARWSW